MQYVLYSVLRKLNAVHAFSAETAHTFPAGSDLNYVRKRQKHCFWKGTPHDQWPIMKSRFQHTNKITSIESIYEGR